MYFSDPKHSRLWVTTSKPVLQMFVLLSQTCQQETWDGGWAWCPGKAAESDWESVGVAELFSSFSQRQSRDTSVFLFLLSFWTPFCTQTCPWTKYLEAHTFQEMHITLSSSSLCMAYTTADPKAQVRGKTVVEIQGKKEARAPLTTSISPPKVGMDIHGLVEARVSMSLTAIWKEEPITPNPSHFPEWAVEDLLYCLP